MHTTTLIEAVLSHTRTHGLRTFPWRTGSAASSFPYRVLVSEIMLQQTQTQRVIPYFQSFIRAFPSVRSLARASTREVLAQWSGLGYNRRAVFLSRAAAAITKEHKGRVPKQEYALRTLPGVGVYTAASVCALAYNEPTVVIETNIRTAVIEHSFPRTRSSISDTEIHRILGGVLKDPRVRALGARYWYSALMDYGAHLKHHTVSHNTRVKGHVYQSAFTGSLRALRGALVRMLLETKNGHTAVQLKKKIKDPRVSIVLNTLKEDGMVVLKGSCYCIAD